jgi:hypothetical protein
MVVNPGGTITCASATERLDFGGKSVSAQRVDMYDDLTKIQAWLDDSGNLVRLEAPAQKVRVLRLPPGDDEAQALARAAGPANPTGSAARR